MKFFHQSESRKMHKYKYKLITLVKKRKKRELKETSAKCAYCRKDLTTFVDAYMIQYIDKVAP